MIDSKVTIIEFILMEITTAVKYCHWIILIWLKEKEHEELLEIIRIIKIDIAQSIIIACLKGNYS